MWFLAPILHCLCNVSLSRSTIILTPWELVGLFSVDQSPSMGLFGIKMQLGLFQFQGTT